MELALRTFQIIERQNNMIDIFLNFGKRNIAFTKNKVDGISPMKYRLPLPPGNKD